MRIVFLGVGEAFDERESNTSLLALPAQYDADAILLDCGFTAAAAYFRHAPAALHADGLQAIYLTHMHGDHFLGLPWLLHRLGEDGRTRSMEILGPKGVREVVSAAYEIAYPSSFSKLPFSLAFTEVTPELDVSLDQWRFRFAPSRHSQPNFSIRLEREERTLCYSGDGAPSEGTLALARETDLLVQESYFLEKDKDPTGASGHGSAEGSIEFARKAGAKRLALVHIARSVRHGRREDLKQLVDSVQDLQVFIPQEGYALTI